MRVAHIQVVAGYFQHACVVKKACIDSLQRVACRTQALFNVEQQNLVKLRHRFGRPVVTAHQRLAGAAL